MSGGERSEHVDLKNGHLSGRQGGKRKPGSAGRRSGPWSPLIQEKENGAVEAFARPSWMRRFFELPEQSGPCRPRFLLVLQALRGEINPATWATCKGLSHSGERSGNYAHNVYYVNSRLLILGLVLVRFFSLNPPRRRAVGS